MRYLLISLLFLSCCGTKKQQATAGSDPSGANVSTNPATGNGSNPDTVVNPGPPVGAATGNKTALYFGSMASGPIGDDFLKEWLQNFNRVEKTTITADKFSACGKEGEYIIVVYKNGFTAAKESRFSSGLEKLVTEEVKKRKAENPSSGSVEIRQNPAVEEYSYCRLGAKKWL